jgi:hypothetical protein
MILYKGPVVEFIWNKGRTRHGSDVGSTDAHHWLMGVFMLLFSCFCWSAFFLVQVSSMKITILMKLLSTSKPCLTCCEPVTN